jgi:hypothetical protein
VSPVVCAGPVPVGVGVGDGVGECVGVGVGLELGGEPGECPPPGRLGDPCFVRAPCRRPDADGLAWSRALAAEAGRGPYE